VSFATREDFPAFLRDELTLAMGEDPSTAVVLFDEKVPPLRSFSFQPQTRIRPSQGFPSSGEEAV